MLILLLKNSLTFGCIAFTSIAKKKVIDVKLTFMK